MFLPSFFYLYFHSITEMHCGPHIHVTLLYRGADKSLARPTSRCILFDGENISFDASLVIYINNYDYKWDI